jgi:hypothetical protein
VRARGWAIPSPEGWLETASGFEGGERIEVFAVAVLRVALAIAGAAQAIRGVGGGVYNLGMFTFDSFTVIRKNHASTSNDDLFDG